MEGVACIHIRGQLGSLGNSIIQRLLRDEVSIIVHADNFAEVNKKFSTEIEFSESQIHSSENVSIAPGHRILLLGFENYNSSGDDSSFGIGIDGAEVILVTPNLGDIEIDASEVDAHITIHDMIPNDSIYPWNCQILDGIFKELVGGNSIALSNGAGWWIGELDVADAISRLVLSSSSMPELVQIAGRRSWANSQILEELQILYSRTMAGQSGDFTTEHLTSPRTPKIELVVVDGSIQDNRPDLKTLHESLFLADGEGWRPMTPIRTALMHFLIGKMK